MDRVRFGRALGVGARHAAKSLLNAAEAAAAPDPNAERTRARASAERATAPPSASQPQARAAIPAQVQSQTRQLGRSVWNPVAKFSSVLWLEVTGCFFGIFAFMPGQAAWKLRGAILHGPHAPLQEGDVHRFYLYAGMCAVFVYFAVSSFVRARRRQRR